MQPKWLREQGAPTRSCDPLSSVTVNKTAHRGLAILEYLAASGSRGLSVLADDLGMTRPTAHRFLAGLVEDGYVRQDPGTRHYSMTMKMVAIAAQILEGINLRAELRPYLEETAKVTGDRTHLAMLDGVEVAYLDVISGTQPVQMRSAVGGRGKCHSTALGKVLLAYLPDEDLTRFLDSIQPLSRLTENTIVDPAAFVEELAITRERGYAVDYEENETGIRCAAAPIRDHRGEVVAAVSVSGWPVSMPPERIPEVGKLVAVQAARMSAAVGCPSEFLPDLGTRSAG